LSHVEIFEDFEKYKMELPQEMSDTHTADTTDDCLAGTYRKLNVD